MRSTRGHASQYLYHNGFAFSLIILEEDEDIKVMFRASVNNTIGLYLYVSKGTNPAAGNGQKIQWTNPAAANRQENTQTVGEVLHIALTWHINKEIQRDEL